VGAENYVTLCDLGVFVDQATEPVSPQDAYSRRFGAAVMTVVGVVFSIIPVTLNLASTEFGLRMLRNFIRDPAAARS
jgi:uncharacterized membrane protein